MPTATQVLNYSNLMAPTQLVGAITNVATSMVVASVANAPAVPYKLTIERNSPSNVEVVLVTAAAGATLTVTRGYDGTTGKAHADTALVEHTSTAQDLQLTMDHARTASISTAHGAVVQADVTNGYVDLASTQTIAGAKTFSNAAVFSSTVNSVGNLSENGNRVYSAGNAPPYPVTSVATRTGAIALTAADIAAGTFPGNLTMIASATLTFTTTAGNNAYIAAITTALRMRGGTTGFIWANNADSVNNMTLSDAGALNTVGNITENGNRVYSSANANLSSTTPAAIAAAGAVGTGTTYARPDHVHSGVLTVAGRNGAVTLTAADIGSGIFPSSMTFASGLATSQANGGIELGPSGTSNTPFIDFHSGATGVDYDTRILASGGTGVSGAGTLSVYATSVVFVGGSNSITVGDGTGSPAVRMNGVAGGAKLVDFQTAGLSRWKLLSLATAETGANAGSDFVIRSFDDSGAQLANPLTIVRATGAATFTSILSVSMLGAAGNGMIGLLDTTASQTTPNKYIRSRVGQLEILNSASSAIIASVSDVGALAVSSSIASGGNITENGNRVYSAANAPPYPVTSVATRTGAIVLTAADIGAGTFPGSLTMPVNNSIFFNITGSATAAEIRAAGVDFDIKVGSANGMRFVNNAYTLAIATLSNAGAFTITDRFTVANAGTQGLISVAYNGATADNDAYGIVGVTAPASVNRAYYSMTAAGNSVYGMGMGTDNVMRIGAISSTKVMGANVVRIDGSANVSTPGTVTAGKPSYARHFLSGNR